MRWMQRCRSKQLAALLRAPFLRSTAHSLACLQAYEFLACVSSCALTVLRPRDAVADDTTSLCPGVATPVCITLSQRPWVEMRGAYKVITLHDYASCMPYATASCTELGR